MYEQLFELIFKTEPLFDNFWLDMILPLVISTLLYGVAFRIAGESPIRQPDFLSLIHWCVRLGITWLIINILILIRDNWLYILISIFVLLFVYIVIYLLLRLRKNKA